MHLQGDHVSSQYLRLPNNSWMLHWIMATDYQSSRDALGANAPANNSRLISSIDSTETTLTRKWLHSQSKECRARLIEVPRQSARHQVIAFHKPLFEQSVSWWARVPATYKTSTPSHNWFTCGTVPENLLKPMSNIPIFNMVIRSTWSIRDRTKLRSQTRLRKDLPSQITYCD